MDPARGDLRLSGTPIQDSAVRSCPIALESPTVVLSVLPRPRFAWLDATGTLLAGGCADAVTATGPDRFAAVREQAGRLFDRIDEVARNDGTVGNDGAVGTERASPAARPRLVGGFSFSDDHDPSADSVWEGFPGARFHLPSVQIVLDGDTGWLTTAASGPTADETARRRLEQWRSRIASLPTLAGASAPGIEERRWTTTERDWAGQVEDAVSRISGGRLDKVVLAQSLSVTATRPIDVSDLLARLGNQYPNCCRFMLDADSSGPPGGGTFFGATPERLITLTDREVQTVALAGSIDRGETEAADRQLARRLRSSEKNRHEHDLVVEAICEQLQPTTVDRQIGDRSIRTLETVQHLETPITARLPATEHVLTLVEDLHPTPAVGGLPPDRALRTIREAESFERGWYAAPVGWFDRHGDGAFAVAIRSGIARGQSARLFAGAGIVEDSDPSREWDELQWKFRPILDALQR